MFFLIINIAILLPFTSIFNFYNDMSKFNKIIDEILKENRKLDERTNRLLVKYKGDNEAHIVCLKDIQNNIDNKKKDVSNNEKEHKTKVKQSNGSSSRNVASNKQYKKNNSCIFETKKYSHLEKKIFNELDYIDFLNNNRTITNQMYKKIILKKFSLRVALPLLLFLLLLISLILDKSMNRGLAKGLFELTHLFYGGKGWYNALHQWLNVSPLSGFFRTAKKIKYTVLIGSAKTTRETYLYVFNFFDFIIYTLPLFILGVMLILGVFYYHKKVKKYNKIKFRKR
ncbi:fam-l protein [Plasmodium malariae]|uniref:Fam-l protein n=1 Tax=Plasmodium malariae TaxID=5858 RepID=A0A1D3JH51_PLAMA|nr:fam-l protein [Plasmodium malariae]SBT85650.1 fam-l protein [Plasmodium malariae]